MAGHYLLDTNICIYVLSGRYPELADRVDSLGKSAVHTSVIVLGELAYGIAKSKRKRDAQSRLDSLLIGVSIDELPASAGEHYGDIRATLEAAGKPIDANDLWIAAHARADGLTLVTNNTREFRRVKGLKVENWV